MGIYTKLTDIVNSNVNAILDKAQDPVKIARLMVQEMEDTLVEIKSSIAQVLADKKKVARTLEEKMQRIKELEENAALAISKGKDDLARRIVEQGLLIEKRAEELGLRDNEYKAIIDEYRNDLTRLEEKLAEAREKSATLQHKIDKAKSHNKVEKKIYEAKTSSAFKKFSSYAEQLDILQSEGEVTNMGTKTLDDEIEQLKHENAVNDKLKKLKEKQ